MSSTHSIPEPEDIYFDDSNDDAPTHDDITAFPSEPRKIFGVPIASNKLTAVIVILGILLTVLILIALCILLTALITRLKYSSQWKQKEQKHEFHIESGNVMRHLERLNEIGLANPGKGRTARGGYNESAVYVETVLGVTPEQLAEEDSARYFVYRRQYFDTFDFYVNKSSVLLEVNNEELKFGKDFELLSFAGSTPTTEHGQQVQEIVRVVFIPNYGCEQVDYDAVKEPFFGGDSLFVVKRGDCDFKTKADLTFANGANALVIYNEGNAPDRQDIFSGTLGGIINNGIGPVFTVSHKTAQEWKKLLDQNALLNIRLFLQTQITTVPTFNLIMDVASTYPQSKTNTIPTVLIGSHLDGVSAGPGVNDNGSGSMSTLEIARTFMAQNIRPKNHVRFCFWGAEENGLVGSEWYVAHISQEERQNIAMNLNFDMLGSPNYIRGLYEARTSPLKDMIAPSERIQRVFEHYFATQQMTYKYVPFNGRSDYGPFLDVGIPAGGLETGHENFKTMEERHLFGGIANAPHDPCYHLACDTVENISEKAIYEMSNAAGNVLLEFANMGNLVQYLNGAV